MFYSFDKWEAKVNAWFREEGGTDPGLVMHAYSNRVTYADPDPDTCEYRVVNEYGTVVATNTTRAFEGKEMRDQTGGMMNVADLKGRVVWSARARLGGILWPVGIYAEESGAKKALKEYWPLGPEVTEHIVTPSTVM